MFLKEKWLTVLNLKINLHIINYFVRKQTKEKIKVNYQKLEERSRRLRVETFDLSRERGGYHFGGALSAIEILVTLYHKILKPEDIFTGSTKEGKSIAHLVHKLNSCMNSSKSKVFTFIPSSLNLFIVSDKISSFASSIFSVFADIGINMAKSGSPGYFFVL